ncbi:hypothetical protein EWD52_23410 [Salmonella enterica subsp. enterica serovar Braenderup]|nr:hypothetical protein [Salmonella enterica subsp. enterica serovar Braenderup]ECD1500247.1 hypothetical protein [Salmonella enterica subsp. enterica serovar Braenderup]
MGLFGGVSQADFDAMKKNHDVLRFRHSCEEMKSNIAKMLGYMKMHTGKASGFIDSVKIFYDAEMLETAKILYAEVRPLIVEAITASREENNRIYQTVEELGDCKQAFLNYCLDDESPINASVNEINALNENIVNLVNSMDNVFL